MRYLALLLLLTSCNLKYYSGVVVEKSKSTTHYVVQVSEYHFIMVEGTVTDWDTTRLGDFKRKINRNTYENEENKQ